MPTFIIYISQLELGPSICFQYKTQRMIQEIKLEVKFNIFSLLIAYKVKFNSEIHAPNYETLKL